MSLADRQKILQQKANQLARPLAPGQQDPRFAERPNDVVFYSQQVTKINLRLALLTAPVDLLYKARDQINELINQSQNGGRK